MNLDIVHTVCPHSSHSLPTKGPEQLRPKHNEHAWHLGPPSDHLSLRATRPLGDMADAWLGAEKVSDKTNS